MKLLKRLAFCFLLIVGFTAVAKAEDTIYLKDGKVVHGKIIKKFPSGSVKIRTASGKETVYKKSSIKNIVHTDSAPVAMSASPKKVHHHEHAEMASGAIDGVNNVGRPGYFYSDTAYVPNKGQVMGAAGIVFYSPGSQLFIPVGAAFGVAENLQLHANTNFYSFSGASGLYYLTFGGKYSFKTKTDNLLFAAGLDMSVGPLSGPLSTISTFNFDPYGIVTYGFKDGLQLNGQLGLYVPGGSKIGGFSFTPAAYLQLNAGAAYPFDANLTGIAELGVNGLGSANTPLVVGLRTGHDVQLQAFAGLDLAATVGVVIGGNVALVSQ
jgi:hypothetical protein